MQRITKAFEAAIIGDYDAQSAVERELALRLASLLWRLRRATTMETGLFEIQAENVHEFRQTRQVHPDSRDIVNAMFGRADAVAFDRDRAPDEIANGKEAVPSFGTQATLDPTAELARCFLRLANLPSCALDRLSRYEARLWRQLGQVLFTLDALNRRKPQERGHRFHSSGGRAPVNARPRATRPLSTPIRNYGDVFFDCKLGRDTVGFFLELGEEIVKITASERPFKRLCRCLVTLLEAHQIALESAKIGEVIGRQELALDDGEVDLDLVEPTGMNRRVNEDDVWPLGLQTIGGALAAM